MDELGVKRLLQRKLTVSGKNVCQWCEEHGVFRSHVYEFMAGRRGPSMTLILALGLRKVVRYEPLNQSVKKRVAVE